MLELRAFYKDSLSGTVEWSLEDNNRFLNSFLVGHVEDDKFVTYNAVGPCRDSFLNTVHRKLASAPTSKIKIAYIYKCNSGEDIVKKINNAGLIKEFKFEPFYLLIGTKLLKLAGIIGEVDVYTYKDPLFFWHYTEQVRYNCSGFSKVHRDGTFYGTTIYDKFLNYCFYKFDYELSCGASMTKHMGIKNIEIIGLNSPFIFYNTLQTYPGYLARAYCEKPDHYSVTTKANFLELLNSAHPFLRTVDYNGWSPGELEIEFNKLRFKYEKKFTK